MKSALPQRIVHNANLRSTRAIIDLDKLDRNVRIIRDHLAPNVTLIAVVKANAYGHGAVQVASAALRAGATELAVATVDEGIQLRHAGIEDRIQILSPVDDSELAIAVRHRLVITVSTVDQVDSLAQVTPATPQGFAEVNLKIDTGMRRGGVMPHEAAGIAGLIAGIPTLHLADVMTHFSDADESDDTPTRQQAAILDNCIDAIQRQGIAFRRTHAANSAGMLKSSRFHYDAVRLGIAMYGVSPGLEVSLPDGVQPVLRLMSRVSRIIQLAPADRVGYGGTFIATEPMTAALIPIGYADGLRRDLSQGGWVGYSGQRCRLIGRVSMDQAVFHMPSDMTATIGDEVEVIGDPSSGAMSVTDLANHLNTIGYEVLTGLAARVPRVYLRQGEAIAISRLDADAAATMSDH